MAAEKKNQVNHRKFTPARVKRWVLAYLKGKPVSTIAEQDGAHHASVVYWLLRSGINSTDDPTRKVASIGEQAYRLKKTTNSTWNKIQLDLQEYQSVTGPIEPQAQLYAEENGEPWPPAEKYPAKMKARWIQLYRQGMSAPEIGKLHGTNRQTVYNALNASGIQIGYSTDRLPTRKAKQAYNMRMEKRVSWKEIGLALWPKPGKSADFAYSLARYYANYHELLWPCPKAVIQYDPRSEQAYWIRFCHHTRWSKIGKDLWPDSNPKYATQSACNAAGFHAKREGLPWPIEIPPDESS